MKYSNIPIILSFIFIANTVYAGPCDDYPYFHQQKYFELLPDGKMKILVTAREDIAVNDAGVVTVAMETAGELARAEMSRFMLEETGRYCESTDTTTQTITYAVDENSPNKNTQIERIKERVCSLANATSALLTGVYEVARCVQVNEEPRVVYITVGVSPDSQEAASRLSEQTNDSLNRSTRPQGTLRPGHEDQGSSGGGPLNRDYDRKDTEGLKKF